MQKLSSVLLVDDDPIANFLNEQLLSSLGVTDQCLVAHNGAEALDMLAQACAPPGAKCPLLVLLDVHMPVMNGIDFLEAYQPMFPQQRLVVVVLTTSLHPGDLARFGKLPVASWVNKPLTRDKVDVILRQHFHRELPLDAPVAQD